MSVHAPPARAHKDSMCYIIFTSGSTGKPKGAVMQHDGVINNLRSLATCAPWRIMFCSVRMRMAC